jgi:predicted ribosomally synthesized peptide with SipW-like signal peptide
MGKNIKLTSLVMNVIAIVIASVLLIGATFAWFTDVATSSGNKIKAGTLKVDLELLDAEQDTWVSLKGNNAPIFDYENWEPGYTDVKVLKVENEGTLALKWKAKFVSNAQLSELANVIDVYVLASEDAPLAYPADRSLAGYTCVGTVAEFVNTIEATTFGTLIAGDDAYLAIALKMRESVDDEYQGVDLGGTFDIQIVATQLSSESDSFGDDYDVNA